MSDQAFNERCAKAFGYRVRSSTVSDALLGQLPTDRSSQWELLPDFANSPEWCWKAWEEMRSEFGTFDAARRVGNQVLNMRDETAETMDGKLHWREGTLLAFCAYRESITPERTT